MGKALGRGKIPVHVVDEKTATHGSNAGLEGSPLFWAQFAPSPTKSQLAAKLRIKRQDHRAWWWFGTLSSPLLKGGKEMGMGYPGLWARHAGSPSRQALGDGWEESWSFPQSFSLQGTGRLAAELGERRGPWGGGQQARNSGLTLTCKVQLPHELRCFLSNIRINTQTQPHAHMRRRLCIPEGGDLDLPAPKELHDRSQASLR